MSALNKAFEDSIRPKVTINDLVNKAIIDSMLLARSSDVGDDSMIRKWDKKDVRARTGV
jgi:hypothetical protein